MLKRMLWLGIGIVLMLAAVNGMAGAVSEEQHEAIADVLEQNLQATAEEDVSGILKTMHPDNEAHHNEAVVADMEQLFAMYDLNYDLEIMDMYTEAEDVLVTYRQITWADDDPDFMDNVLTGVHTMRRYAGEWRLLDSEILTTEPYVGEPDN